MGVQTASERLVNYLQRCNSDFALTVTAWEEINTGRDFFFNLLNVALLGYTLKRLLKQNAFYETDSDFRNIFQFVS